MTALVNAGSGEPSARYDYAPFGELLRASGEAAALNPFRFSTKYADAETGLLYYGYRYYNRSMGKWISRDPLEEKGGLNLYAFVENNPVNLFDALGQTSGSAGDTGAASTEAAGLDAGGGGGEQAIGIKNRIRDAIDAYENVQDFMSTIMDCANGDVTKFLMEANEGLAKNFGRGNGTPLHHLMPKKDIGYFASMGD